MQPLDRKVDKAVSDVVRALRLLPEVRRATKYLSPKLTVKATQQRTPGYRSDSMTILLTIGAPNYAERAFIASCVAAGESFPVRKVQFREFKTRRK